MVKTAMLFPSKRVSFLVVSDEPKSPLDFPGLQCSWGSGIPVEDMYLLGRCDYIISNAASSFSLWPSFLYQIPNLRISKPDLTPTISDFKTHTTPWIIKTHE
jgi:hypothetical protein